MDMPQEAIVELSEEASNFWFVALIVCLLILIAVESFLPALRRPPYRKSRWPTNLSLGVLVVLVGMLSPISTVLAANWARTEGFGLLNILPAPAWLSFIATLAIRSFIGYVFHVLAHKIPFLWRLHRVHHSDTHLDATTGLRAHPLELALFIPYAVAISAVFGLSAWALIIYELADSLHALFAHSNLRLPDRIDRVLRWVFVTPNMHCAHHSSWQPETDSNYGTLFSVWDRLFGTYTDKPRGGYDTLQIGLDEIPQKQATSFWWQLRSPLIRLQAAKPDGNETPSAR